MWLIFVTVKNKISSGSNVGMDTFAPILYGDVMASSTSCARGDTIYSRPLYAGHCGPDAAAQLQPIPYACGAQRALFPIRRH